MTINRLNGRVALITGGSRGIGRAVAERFALEGASIAINHVRDDAEAQIAMDACTAASLQSGHASRPHFVVEADVSSASAVDAMMAEVIGTFGKLDILVNNAGIQASTPGDNMETLELERIIAVNLIGAAHCARAAIRHFLTLPQQSGVIINTSSVHEVIPKPGYLAYSMSKGGLGNLTRTLALEFADRHIRVNGVGPGAILTSLNDQWRNDPVGRADVERHIPMGYAAAPNSSLRSLLFLRPTKPPT